MASERATLRARIHAPPEVVAPHAELEPLGVLLLQYQDALIRCRGQDGAASDPPAHVSRRRGVQHRTQAKDHPMSRSVKLDTESLRESQARAQQADRIGPDQERADSYEREDHG